MVLPDLLATINKEWARSIERSTCWMEVGSVESSTKKRLLDVAGQMILQRGRFRAHGIKHANPAEPIRDDAGVFGVILPKARLPGPHLLDRLAGSKPTRFFLIHLCQITRFN